MMPMSYAFPKITHPSESVSWKPIIAVSTSTGVARGRVPGFPEGSV